VVQRYDGSEVDRGEPDQKAAKSFELAQYDSAPLAIEDVLNGRIVAAAMDDAPALDAAKKKPVKILGGFGMRMRSSATQSARKTPSS